MFARNEKLDVAINNSLAKCNKQINPGKKPQPGGRDFHSIKKNVNKIY
jgi:hypothetical protein